MGVIVVRLKTIKYKMNITRYLSLMPLGLAIEPSHQAYWSIRIS